jgi:serine/threonine protein kinase
MTEIVYRPNNETGISCNPDNWRIKEYISHGVSGKVFVACCGDDCDYVVKSIFFGTTETSELKRNEFRREVQIHRLLSRHFIAPAIYMAWMTATHGYIVMRRLAMTLKQYVEIYGFSKEDVFRLISVVNLMHHHGVVHKDLHNENVLVDTSNNFYIIDFGKSKLTVLETSKSRKLMFGDFVTIFNALPIDRDVQIHILKWLHKHFPKSFSLVYRDRFEHL